MAVCMRGRKYKQTAKLGVGYYLLAGGSTSNDSTLTAGSYAPYGSHWTRPMPSCDYYHGAYYPTDAYAVCPLQFSDARLRITNKVTSTLWKLAQTNSSWFLIPMDTFTWLGSLTSNCRMGSFLIVQLFLLYNSAHGFNLDVDMPLFKYGPPNSYFGYAVAQHFIGNDPFLLVGAPKDTGLPKTNETGALYSCNFNTYYNKQSTDPYGDDKWCKKAVLERLRRDQNGDLISSDGREDQWRIHIEAGYPLHGGDGHSWFGATIGSSAAKPGSSNRVLVCAPTLVLEEAAFLDGSCFLLNNDLHQLGPPIRDCKSESRKDRHNAFGYCEQGFSAVLSEKYETIVTGLPGVVRWTGGAVARDLNDPTNYRDSKRKTGPGAIETAIKSHSYFSYSVNVGRFGFPFEVTGSDGGGKAGDVYTLVFGSPRTNDTGAVFFGKFHKNARSLPVAQQDDLRILPDFHLEGDDLIAAGFGYTVTVGDVNNDGLDDLLVGSPYYFNASSKQHRGGAVYVYFASGRASSFNYTDVFLPPVKLFGPTGSNFGTSITFLGDINEDNFQDFAIGAPFTENGGTVYVYLGGRHEDFLLSTVTPIQVIHGADISGQSSRPISTFGWSLAGGSDLDSNGYPDLVVGAFMADAAITLRTRPIIHVKAEVVKSDLLPVDKDIMVCPDNSGDICFSFHTILRVSKAKGYNVDLSSNLFKCRLEVMHYETAAKRAFFEGQSMVREWSCGQNADRVPQKQRHRLRIRRDNSDWLNPLKFQFEVGLTPEPRRAPVQGEDMPSLRRHPVLDKRGSEHEFLLPFNKKCGSDNECLSDLRLECQFVNLTKETTPSGNIIYVKQSGTGRTLDLAYTITNEGERAYESVLNITYDTENIEDMQLIAPPSVRLKTALGEVPAIIALGNPLQEKETVELTVRFTISQSRAGGFAEPLKFISEVISSSQETNSDDNQCVGEVKVIKQVDVQFGGQSHSTRPILYYGGKVVGESAMTHIDDIGQEVFHVYTVSNKGPWVINNARVIVDFPYEVWSCRECGAYHGKWALYVTAEPQVEVSIPGEGVRIKRTCRVEDPDGINPLKLTVGGDTTTGSIIENVKSRAKRSARSEDLPVAGQNDQMENTGRKLGRQNRDLRVKPIPVPYSTTYYVRISCADEDAPTANCLRISCYLDSLQVNSAASVRIRASLWNSTFVEDYRDVEYVILESKGKLQVDPAQAIELLDQSQSTARVETRAQPDIPTIPDKRRVPIWIIVLSVIGGIFLLFLITILFWKCGFFERRRDPNQPLYTAQYKHGEDLDEN